MDRENLAAIDLGTNSCRLRITDKAGNLLYRDAVTVKLGEGMYANQCFTPSAIERGLNCFIRYAEEMQNYNVGLYRAIATASCRMAKNGAEFVQMVKNKAGIELEVINGHQEAVLNLRGAILNADKNAEYIMIYDLGGGSTELTLATNEKNPQVLHTISIPWGARNASEAFDLVEYNAENAEKLRAEIAKYVADFALKSNFSKCRDKCCCISTSSTPLRLLCMVENTGIYNQDYADGRVMTTKDITAKIEEMWKTSVAQLAQNPYIGLNRAPIIVSASVIFRAIYDGLQIEKITASLKGAQEAIIEELRNHG